MGWRGTLLLLAAAVAAGWLLYRDVNAGRDQQSWQAVFEEPKEVAPGDLVKRLLSFDPASVTTVTVRMGDREWSAARDGAGWSGAGQASDMDGFVRDLSELAEILPIEATAEALREHGLEPPQGSVELQRRDLPPVLLLIGARNPPATGVYVRIGADGPIALTGALLLWDIEKVQRAFGPGT
jgi:hypothetical protein